MKGEEGKDRNTTERVTDLKLEEIFTARNCMLCHKVGASFKNSL